MWGYWRGPLHLPGFLSLWQKLKKESRYNNKESSTQKIWFWGVGLHIRWAAGPCWGSPCNCRFSVKSAPDDRELGNPGGHAGGNSKTHLHPLHPPQLCKLNVGLPRQHQKYHFFTQVLSPSILREEKGGATRWKTRMAGTFGKVG